MPSFPVPIARIALPLLLTASLAACGARDAPGPAAGAAGAVPPPPAVGVITVRAGAVPLATELPGRVSAWRIAQVRARAAGIVQQRLFQEGSEVRAGQVLYRIEPAPLEAALASATAVLRRAEAALASARQKETRYRPLVASRAVSEQEFADMTAARELAEAEVEAARAARESARLNLSYSTVVAPITGRIGRSLVTEGALVGQGEASQLATIQQLDPVYVDLTQSSAEYLRLRQALASQSVSAAGTVEVQLQLEDGSAYPSRGRLLFTDATIDPATSSVSLRVSVPNPQRLLLPGMYVRASFAQAVEARAWRVPQQAVLRRADGAGVFLAGPDDKVVLRPVKTAGTLGTDWIVTEGLNDGDRVIVDGLQKTGPGATVRPVPWQAAAPGSVQTPPSGTGSAGAAR